MCLHLFDLPDELLLKLLSYLPPSDLARVSQTCGTLRLVARDETLWMARSLNDYQVELRVSETFSPREFYQSILYKFGPLFGIWQRIDLRYYSSLLKIYFKNQEVIIEEILPFSRVLSDSMDVHKETLMVIYLSEGGQGDIKKASYLYKQGEVKVSYEGNEIFAEDGDIHKKSMSNVPRSFLGNDTKAKDGILRIDHHSIESVRLCDYIENEVNKTWFEDDDNLDYELLERRYEEILQSNSSRLYRRFKNTFNNNSNLTTGLFIGDYGPHGREFINVELLEDGVSLRGVKVTGDPNVPFDKTTFETDHTRCLDMTEEDQESCSSINTFMDNPKYIDYQEGLKLHFTRPMCHGSENVPSALKTCQGRWSVKCQVASDHDRNPTMIPGNLVVFNQDMFAVIFLNLHSMSIYKRVTQMLL